MRQIDKLRNKVAEELSLPKDLVKDVCNFTCKELLRGFHNGDVIEVTGLCTFFVRNKIRMKLIKETERNLALARKYQAQGKKGFKSEDFSKEVEDLEQDLIDLQTKYIPHEFNKTNS